MNISTLAATVSLLWIPLLSTLILWQITLCDPSNLFDITTRLDDRISEFQFLVENYSLWYKNHA